MDTETKEAFKTLARSGYRFKDIRRQVFLDDYLDIRKRCPERLMTHIYMDIQQRYGKLCNDITEERVQRIILGD